MKTMKLVVSLLLTGLIVLFVVQNTESVEVSFFFWEISMSRSLLIFFLLAIGILVGWLLNSYMSHRSGKKIKSPPQPDISITEDVQ